MACKQIIINDRTKAMIANQEWTFCSLFSLADTPYIDEDSRLPSGEENYFMFLDRSRTTWSAAVEIAK